MRLHGYPELAEIKKAHLQWHRTINGHDLVHDIRDVVLAVLRLDGDGGAAKVVAYPTVWTLLVVINWRLNAVQGSMALQNNCVIEARSTIGTHSKIKKTTHSMTVRS